MNSVSTLPAILLGVATWIVSGTAIAGESPNVLFIIVDDLRPQLGVYGADGMHTPNIDGLAEEGLVFKNAYSHWPACGPARTSIMSGLRPGPAAANRSLPGHFKDHGYYTHSVGKIYHDRAADLSGWSDMPWHADTAIDNWQGYASDESHELRQQLWQQAKETDPEVQLYQINGEAVEAAPLPDDLYLDSKTANKAIEILGKTAGKPFFLAVGFEKPHFPFAAPQQYWDLYQRNELHPAKFASRPEGSTNIPYIYSELHQYHGLENEGPPSQEKVRELIHGYYACVSFIDAQIGKLLNELDRLKLRNKTIVVLMSDHGLQLGEQAVWGKHSLYEKSLHTPLIVSVPGQTTAGETSSAIVEHVDIYPSLSQLAGLPLPAKLDGLSFAALLDDLGLPGEKAALSQYRHFMDPYNGIMGYSLRTQSFRYTEWQDEQDPETFFDRELYDMSVDASEQVNLAHDPRYANIVEELSNRIAATIQGYSLAPFH